MTDFKIKKRNYTMTYNDIFRVENNGEKLSLDAWGLYVFMLSLPDDWDYTIMGLTKVVNAGKNKIQRILKELEQAGFISRKQINKGKFGKIEYTINDKPVSPYPQNPYTENPHPQNQPQLITKEQSTKEQNDKLMIKGEKFPQEMHFLTKELVSKDFINALDYEIINFDNLFKKLDNNFNYQLVLSATRYLVSSMKKNKQNYNNKFAYFERAIYTNLELLNNEFKNNNNVMPDMAKDFLNDLKKLEN